MSSPLALAAVTATLCDLLNDGLIDNDLAPLGSFSVTALPPDRIDTGNNEANRLNLFLYQVTANQGWRNEGLPSRDPRSVNTRLSNPPLALDLHYMLTAYGGTTFAAEILLGYGMELLHESPVLTRANIRKALDPNNPISLNVIPADPQGRRAIDLADQIEQVKVTPHYMSADELARMWTAMQARYRPTMVYQVSTILIQGTRPVRSPLPVLTRGPEDRGNDAQAILIEPPPSRPTIQSLGVVPSAEGEVREAAEMGDAIELRGALLGGGPATAEFRHLQLRVAREAPAAAGATERLVRVVLPQSHLPGAPGFAATADQDWPAGIYTVRLRIDPPGELSRYTNDVPFVLAPRLAEAKVAPAPAGGRQLTVKFFPQAWPEQAADVFVGGQPLGPGRVEAKTGSLTLPLAGVPPSEVDVPVTLRIGGADTQLVRDRKAQPPQFDPKQKVSLS